MNRVRNLIQRIEIFSETSRWLGYFNGKCCSTAFIYVIYLFITTLFAKSMTSIHRKKGAAREEVNPHIRQPPKQNRRTQEICYIHIKYRKIKKL